MGKYGVGIDKEIAMQTKTTTKTTTSRMTRATVTGICAGHMPDYADVPNIGGLSVREAITELRETGRPAFGNLGWIRADLSDGTQLAVMNQSAHGGGELMSSQVMMRLEPDGRPVRRYAW